MWDIQPSSVRSIAEAPDAPWEQVTLVEGAKCPIQAQRSIMRIIACRKDGNRNYVRPGEEVWLYIRRYEDGTIKYFVSNALEDTSHAELDRAATLRWPIEQYFEKCKSYLGIIHYEGCSYPGWARHMLFVMVAHLFTTQMREMVKKGISLTMAMVAGLLYSMMEYTFFRMQKIVCYHIKKNHCAYLSHRKRILNCSL